MASNALSSRRQLLRRPKVCFVQPNPGRCPPPVAISCIIKPAVRTVPVNVQASFTVTVCDLNSPPGSLVGLSLDGGGGFFFHYEDVLNCQDTPAFFESPNPGVFNLTATFMTESEAICNSPALVIVTLT